ncbi:uncharacterized protein K460DRAFT_380029 [Cucurbitaria berberidis CBS 394.84]|uniref:Nudix hydrolase domain-containing protein n=1 Tax=Cucurbitaria berberidis CBS 394.84 TaxID=1168544 RepID=A0A9P4GBA0_9PLEO|nr:uncharacterized protein K460DRAFT_380029 [Cucurbitaria berberidis CBS 394.84]KAF1842080.1 hypothetical protein K460DRAFT_380029 [Cucurbitaria berberidis CBS 394.84]
MAASRFKSEQYYSESFVESAGAILFRLSTREICVIHLPSQNEYVLAKGRRNLGETRQSAAVREVKEETGYACRLLPLTMSTRNPPAIEKEPALDEPRIHTSAQEPFGLQIRHLSRGDVKVIWWYIAAVNEQEKSDSYTHGQGEFSVEFYSYTDVLKKLTFQTDRDLVEKAIHVMQGTYD